MSATLTFASSGNGAKTGTTNTTFLDDLDTLISSKSGDATFFWQKAGKSNAGTPRYLLLSPKDGSNRRIAIIIWDSAPANNNAAILDGIPIANAVQIAYFPNGSANALSNLTAASGTVCGNDTGVVKCTPIQTVANIYGTSFVPFYFDSAETMFLGFANPAAATLYGAYVGSILVDSADVAYDAVAVANQSVPWNVMGGGVSGFMPFVVAVVGAGVTQAATVRTNYGSANRQYFTAWSASGVWPGVAISATDILTDTANNKAWFVPVQLLGQTKGEGFVLKFRQLGYGPASVGAFTTYNTTGPVNAARQVCNTTAGTAGGAPWLTQFKI